MADRAWSPEWVNLPKTGAAPRARPAFTGELPEIHTGDRIAASRNDYAIAGRFQGKTRGDFTVIYPGRGFPFEQPARAPAPGRAGVGGVGKFI